MGFFLVMKAELVRSLTIMRRYWFATVIGIIVGYGMLVGLILGFTAGMSNMLPPETVAEIANGVDRGVTCFKNKDVIRARIDPQAAFTQSGTTL